MILLRCQWQLRKTGKAKGKSWILVSWGEMFADDLKITKDARELISGDPL